MIFFSKKFVKNVKKQPISANSNIAANNVGVCSSLFEPKIILPNPELPVNHSATTAPITDNGIDILKAEKRYGIEVCHLNFMKTSHFEAFNIMKNL